MAYSNLKFKGGETVTRIKDAKWRINWASEWDGVIGIRMWEEETNLERRDHFLLHNFAEACTLPEQLGIIYGILHSIYWIASSD